MIRDLDVELERLSPYLTSSRRRLRRQLAAAGLWRARSLLNGMLALREAGRTDILGLLGRAVFETWVVSLYLLLKEKDHDDDTVLMELRAEYANWLGIMSGVRALSNVEDLPNQIAESRDEEVGELERHGVKPRKLSYASISDQLGSLLQAVEGEYTDVRQLYDINYRSQSMFSAHPSEGTLLRYVRQDAAEQHDSLVAIPAEHGQTRIAALLVTHLAIRVLKYFRVDSGPTLGQIRDRLSAPPAPDET